VGVLKTLEAQGLAPALLAGTSAGSVVGALYASGLTGFALQDVAFSLDEARLRDIDWRNLVKGVLLGQKLQDYVNELVKNRPLESLGKPFVAVATELDTGQRVVFARGNTGQAVRASCSIPGVFQPTLIAGKTYVDGGVVSPVPVDAVRELGADIVIAVDISAKANGVKTGNWFADTLGKSITIMGQKLGEQELARAEVVIRPAINSLGISDFEQKDKAILLGEKAAAAALPAIREAIQKWQAAHP
jgi:NTE family protein